MRTLKHDNTNFSIIKIETADDNSSSSEKETMDNRKDFSQFTILDLSCVTSMDSQGCSLVPWLEEVVKEEGGWLGLVLEGKIEDAMEMSGVLDMLECEVYPTVYDAMKLEKVDIKHRCV